MKSHSLNSRNFSTCGSRGYFNRSTSKHQRTARSKRLMFRIPATLTRHRMLVLGAGRSTSQVAPGDTRFSHRMRRPDEYNSGKIKVHPTSVHSSLVARTANACCEWFEIRTTTYSWPEPSLVRLTNVSSNGSGSGLETSARTAPRSRSARIHHRNRFIDSYGVRVTPPCFKPAPTQRG